MAPEEVPKSHDFGYIYKQIKPCEKTVFYFFFAP